MLEYTCCNFSKYNSRRSETAGSKESSEPQTCGGDRRGLCDGGGGRAPVLGANHHAQRIIFEKSRKPPQTLTFRTLHPMQNRSNFGVDHITDHNKINFQFSIFNFQFTNSRRSEGSKSKTTKCCFCAAKPLGARSRQSRRLAKAIDEDYATVEEGERRFREQITTLSV